MSAAERALERPLYSFALTTYRDEPTVNEFHRRLSDTLRAMGCSYELVFVNDASPDGTFAQLEALFETDPRVSCIIDLMRNTGQGNALTAALAHCRGRRIVLLDSDLQLAPEDFPRLAAKADEGYDIVSAYRENRADPWVRRAGSVVFNAFIRRMTRMRYRDFGCCYKIIDSRLTEAFEFGPYHPFCASALLSASDSVAEVPIRQSPRAHGRSGWTLRRLSAAFVERAAAGSSFLLFLLMAHFAATAAAVLAGNGLILAGASGLAASLLYFNLHALPVLGVSGAMVIAGYYLAHNYTALRHKPAYIIRAIRRREIAG